MQLRSVDAVEFDRSAGSGPAAELRRIVAAADAEDGVGNLNDAARLHLKNHGLAGAALFLAEGGFALRIGADLDLVVEPAARGHGTGTDLARAALTGVEEVDAWSHSDHPAAARIAMRFGVPRARELWVMGRPLDATLPTAEPATDYGVRTFRDDDAERVVEINRLAFAHHPEQGSMGIADFRERTAEPWFDAAGLFLAVDADDRAVGFHWTKEHTDAGQDFGEVYVLAVDPRAAGRGIGTVLTDIGLRHLRERGLPWVILYVEADNAPAIAVYEHAGFTRTRVEAQYRGAPTPDG